VNESRIRGINAGPRLAIHPVWVLAWIITGFLAEVAFFRLVAWDALQIFVILNAFTLILYLPAVVIAVAAIVFRHWWLAAVSLIVVSLYLVFVLPELIATQSIPANIRGAETLRLFDANVYQNNSNMAGYASQIRAFRPDVVILEEADARDQHQLERDGALIGLPHIYQSNDLDSRALLIASHYPLGPFVKSRVDGLSYLTRTSLKLPSAVLPLWAVHTTAPVSPDWHDWSRELAGIDQTLKRAHPRPLLMVGDFNATWGNKGFRAILATGLTDAAAARGLALEMTWSQDFFLVPPLVRIDHILTSPGVIVTKIRTGVGVGSDHRDLMATVAVLSPFRRR
jgi:endonuclease/exonuclease/phosphatase (EEP) superfamily protein YafD